MDAEDLACTDVEIAMHCSKARAEEQQQGHQADAG